MGDPVVELQSGFVRGVVEKHGDGFNYYAFKGIPYAEKPIAELRFEDPVPKKKWKGILDCKNYGPMCMQYHVLINKESVDEDCLHLNVFTRSINKTDLNYPVMVWLHGGEFTYGSGSGDITGPDHLINKDVVLVLVNYRLGVLGFLNLEDEVASGNQGLKDQIMALYWVQKNIKNFGGDPNNVTLFGISAGAISTHYLAVSPVTKGLFQKIICHGNNIYTDWARCENPRTIAIKMCSLLGQNLVDPNKIVTFLRTVEAGKLLEAQMKLRQNTLPFTPGRDIYSKNPVMPIDPLVAAGRGVHIPSLTGYNGMEGLVLFFGSSMQEFLSKCDRDIMNLIPYNLIEVFGRHNLSAAQVRRLYYKNEAISEKNFGTHVELLGDVAFVENVHTFARVQTEQSSAPTYMYRFNYDSPNSPSKRFLVNSPLSGACHYDELPYLFKLGFPEGFENVKNGTRDYRMMKQMVEMWTNFARYGRPTIGVSELIPVHWKPLNDGTVLRFLNIDDDLTMQSTLNIDQKYLSARSIQA